MFNKLKNHVYLAKVAAEIEHFLRASSDTKADAHQMAKTIVTIYVDKLCCYREVGLPHRDAVSFVLGDFFD